VLRPTIGGLKLWWDADLSFKHYLLRPADLGLSSSLTQGGGFRGGLEGRLQGVNPANCGRKV